VSAADMYNSVLTRFDGCDVFIAAAAVRTSVPIAHATIAPGCPAAASTVSSV
jgi:hypothetical protein